jgi:hypothetical protein
MIRYLIIYCGWWLLLVIGSAKAIADNSSLNLALPSMGATYGTDSIRSGDLDCKNSIGGATNFELGVTGIIDNAVSPFSSDDPENPMTKDVGVYARIVIPLDAPKERINCNTLYQLELQRRRIEVMKLQQELENLRNLQKQSGFEN